MFVLFPADKQYQRVTIIPFDTAVSLNAMQYDIGGDGSVAKCN